ncbi:MAG: 5'-nucleotidase C-terminal domain-containing protein [Acidobacteria bacterium]|nr:5'-nucleotidase C-terminal domain-containing protein [Acidobacteriota bacterium]
MNRSYRFALIGLSVLLLVAAVTATGVFTAKADRRPVEIQFLTISDWHAQLDPLSVFGVGTFGGAAELSAYWMADRMANPNTLTLTAGDAYGASPPLSSFFDEVPAVQAMNLMGFDVDTFGNHNFDKGITHLQQMINLADFQYVSANLKHLEQNLSGVKPFEIFDMDGVKVAVIGITNPEAPTLVFPGSFGTIEVTDPVKAAQKARRAAKREGAQIFVAITHLGVTSFDAEGNPAGPLIDFANNVGGFDVIFGDHTDVEFSGIINNALVIENRSKGRTYARTLLTVDPQNGRIIDRSVEFVDPVSSAVTPDPAIVGLLDPLRTELDVLLSGVIGQSTVFIPRADSCGTGNGRTCESLVGDVTTDAMRTTYGTDFAITNSGGLRANLTCPVDNDPNDFCPPFTGPNFDITSGQVLTVLPFGNVVVTLDLNGAELKTMLERGVSAMPGISGRFAQVSGLCFSYDIDAAAGSRVTGAVRQAADGSCTGAVVDLTVASNYTLAENDFMASGGDGYPNFSARAVSRDFMDKVVADSIAASTLITPTIQGRIDCTSSTSSCPSLLIP